MEKLIKMDVPEDRALQMAVFNCYCRQCKNGQLYKCKIERNVRHINKESVTCETYNKWKDNEFDNYIDSLICEQKGAKNDTTS